MFNSKQQNLTDKVIKSTSANPFLKSGLKSSAKTFSGNGAPKYSTTGNAFVDQFTFLGSYKVPRSYSEISTDMSTLYAISKKIAIMFIIYLRLITRAVVLFDGKKLSVQRGAGLKHESIVRMIWLYLNDKNAFWRNINLFISAGSWKDIIYMLSYDVQYNGWNHRVLDWSEFGKYILAGLENPQHSELIKKYLPQIKSNSRCNTIESQADNIIAKWLCSIIYGGKTQEDNYRNYRAYRKLKISGKAHVWQQLISRGHYLKIDFDTIHGRALAQLVSSSFLRKTGLEEKYSKWIESKPIAKFTGYPHELFQKMPTFQYQINTLNAQFMGLVETAKKGAVESTSMIVVRDTSGSMSSTATGSKMSCGNIAKAIALFFSYMLPKGFFANSWIEFNSSALMHTWKGSTPYEKWSNDHSSYIGNTNFMSVIDLFIKIRRNGVEEKDFPTGIICISDGEFDPASLYKTNVDIAKERLSYYFSEKYIDNFKIVLWNLQSNYYGRNTGKKFETYDDVENVYYFSGYDASVIAFLTGKTNSKSDPKTAEELFNAAMDQEILNMVE